MRPISRISMTIFVAGTMSGLAQGGKSSCNNVDIPLSFTIDTTYTDPNNGQPYASGILNDNGGDYMNGQPGVIAHITTCNGSNSATLTPGSSRKVTFNFATQVDGNKTPFPNSVATVDFFYIANVLQGSNGSAYDPNSDYSFTTYLKATLFGPNSGQLSFFNMENPTANQDQFNPPDRGVNTPCLTSLVHVNHFAKESVNSPTPAHETWVAWPDSTVPACGSNPAGQVGTLSVGKLSNFVGQFSVPFYMIIQNLNN